MNRLKITRIIITIEKRLIDTLLCLMLVAMIVLACLQIGLRTFSSGGILWADPILRYLVLWCGMLGAVVATREKKHIGIDVLGYLAPAHIKVWINLVIDVFSTLVVTTLTCVSIVFVQNERLFGGPSVLNVPSWIWNLIFPLAFGLITIHFFLTIPGDIKALLKKPASKKRVERDFL